MVFQLLVSMVTLVYLFILSDIDECQSNSTNSCQFACVNTLGSYRCECPVGYRLGADGKNCQGNVSLNQLRLNVEICGVFVIST